MNNINELLIFLKNSRVTYKIFNDKILVVKNTPKATKIVENLNVCKFDVQFTQNLNYAVKQIA